MPTIQNKLFDEIKIGELVSVQRTLQARDVRAWSTAFGDVSGLIEAGARVDVHDRQGAAAIITALMSALVGSHLPGPGSSIRSIWVQAQAALPIDAPFTAQLVVKEKKPGEHLVVLSGLCIDAAGRQFATAILEVVAPTTRQRGDLPEHRLDGLLDRCRDLKPMLCGVVHPCSAASLSGAIEAAKAGLIVPVLYGPEEALRRLAEVSGLSLSGCHVVPTKDAEDSALKAAMAAGAHEVQVLMKGNLHTDVLLHAILQREANLRMGRLLSHCALVSVPTYARRIVITDVALNIAPDTEQKRDICQNAIGFARALGIGLPKVAVLAAVEMVNTKMQATLDGAILAKMADRGQIVGGIVDGPLDLDAAVDLGAARIKHIDSPVAGLADVLLVPNIEAGNMVYKDLTFMADAQTAGVVVGARVPVILTSRADTAAVRRFSAAAAVLYADALARDPASILPDRAD